MMYLPAGWLDYNSNSDIDNTTGIFITKARQIILLRKKHRIVCLLITVVLLFM